jgi:hypothetical protein
MASDGLMMLRDRRWAAIMRTKLGVSLFFALLPAAVAAENLVVPRDIYEFIKSKNCEQVSDFFERPSVERPPYAVHVAPWGKWEIAVWCTNDMKKVHSDRTYSLLLRFNDDNHPLAKCPDRIDGEKFIGGLAFVDVDDPAESYHFLGTKKKVAAPGKVKTKAIESMYDGTGGYYVCINGKWAARFVH